MTEAQHQSSLFKWSLQPEIRAVYPQLKLLYHIPNGGKRDPIEAKHLKDQGVKKGVPDLHLPVGKGGYHGLYIELKTEKGRTTQFQNWWLAELAKEGYCTAVCQGWKEAAECLIRYLNLKN